MGKPTALLLTARSLVAAGLVSMLVACAAPGPRVAEPVAAPWPVMAQVSTPLLGQWSTEDEAGRTGWRDWEARIRQLADVHVGSALGVPVGDMPVRLHWRHYVHRQEQRGGVVISVGFTEGLTMYQEVIRDLVRNGYSVYIQDHRGQGFSTRLTSGTVGHVNDFDRLVDDLAAFVGDVSAQRGPGARPLFGLAHSMGGAVLAGVLERQGADSPLAAVALFTPMFEPAVAPPGANVLGRALQGWCHRGAWDMQLSPALGTRQAAGQGFEAERDAFLQSATPADNDMSHSVPRLRQRWVAREAACDAGVHCGHGDARVAGPTLQWAMQACHASADIRSVAARRVARPVLLFSGGQDTIVLNGAQAEFCDQVNASHPGRCEPWLLPESRHALLVEKDALRNPALDKMLRFFDDATGPQPR
ncbi:MAG TPA: alpha/beta hydrolase [Burkholderiaceae bacterium]|nr:alpha/beta hydrolase [Burkholderiaceae bacterium]